MKLLKQPTSWTCLAAVCCMITEKPIEDFYRIVGHDGSGKDEKSKHPSKVVAFYFDEGFKYLAEYNFYPYLAFNKTATFFYELNELSITFNPKDESLLYIIDVKSKRFKDVIHSILFFGGVVYDPAPEKHTSNNLNDYEIIQIIPIVKFTRDKV